jgi:hypothetical protein
MTDVNHTSMSRKRREKVREKKREDRVEQRKRGEREVEMKG